MGSQTMPKLPVVDFTKEDLKPGSSCWLSTSNDVQHALEEHGCFIAVYSKVSLELHTAIFNVSKGLFDLPMETKVRNTSDKLVHGHEGNFPTMPLFESFGIENKATLQGTQKVSPINCGPKEMILSALLFSKELSKFGDMVIQMVFESYGVEKYYDSHNESTTHLMRFIKYRVTQEKEIHTGLFAHTDKAFMAMIDQNEIEGLEIETKDGQWINGIVPLPSTFIVIAGEPFMAWSNGRIHALFHRVIIGRNEERYSTSLVLFMGETVQTPEELVDDEHPLQFKPFNQYAFLKFYGEEGMKFKCPIRAYCGV